MRAGRGDDPTCFQPGGGFQLCYGRPPIRRVEVSWTFGNKKVIVAVACFLLMVEGLMKLAIPRREVQQTWPY